MTNKEEKRMFSNLNYEQSNDILTEALTRFWKVELPKKRFLSPEDNYCQTYFSQTTT